MKTITAAKARANLYRLIEETANSGEPVRITGKRTNAVAYLGASLEGHAGDDASAVDARHAEIDPRRAHDASRGLRSGDRVVDQQDERHADRMAESAKQK